MMPRPAARRPPLLGCALTVAVALLLAGCGEEGTAAPDSSTARSSQAQTERVARDGGSTGDGCPRQLDRFVASLAALRSQLAVGLSYEQYAAAIDRLDTSYARVPVERLTIDCLTASGTPAERAMNKHIDAANAWGECLADASCTTAEIEPVLQRKWRLASRSLSAAQ